MRHLLRHHWRPSVRLRRFWRHLEAHRSASAPRAERRGADPEVRGCWLLLPGTSAWVRVHQTISPEQEVEPPYLSLLQHLQCDLFEEDDVVLAVVLQADVAFIRTGAAHGLEIEFDLRRLFTFGVVGHFYAIEHHHCVRAVESDFHGVPLGAGLAGTGQRLRYRIKRAGHVIIRVFLGVLSPIVNLDLITVVDGHPGLAGLDGDPDEDSGIVVLILHLIYNANDAVAELAARPVEQAHAPMGLDEAVFDGHRSGANVLPSGEVFAVKELF